MAKIELRLSGKTESDGTSQILIRFFQGKVFDLYAKSGVFIYSKYFEYYINRSKTAEVGISVPDNVVRVTAEKGFKCGYILKQSGEINNTRRIHDEEWKATEEASKKIESLVRAINDRYKETNVNAIAGDWLVNIVNAINYPELFLSKSELKQSIYINIEDYIKKHQLAEGHARVLHVLSRTISRYEGFVQHTDKNRKGFTFDINRISKEDIEDFADYLRNEKQLSEEYPTIFSKLFEYQTLKALYQGKDIPKWITNSRNVIEPRGENTVIKMLARLKSIFRFLLEEKVITNRPFEGFTIGTEKVGTPFYISIAERNQIAEADLKSQWEKMSREEQRAARMPIETLIAQRDIFIFQCFIGCRIGDLLTMTSERIEKGMLVYTPHKTKNEGKQAVQARVPLHEKAKELIQKYQGVDKDGRLFPFISPQRYNDAIKVIFKMAGVTRNVEVRNALTGETEIKPINEVASSHLARRTFIGGLYFRVADPNIIGKMSGHVEGSKAFSRYRNIEDEQLADVINLIG